MQVHPYVYPSNGGVIQRVIWGSTFLSASSDSTFSQRFTIFRAGSVSSARDTVLFAHLESLVLLPRIDLFNILPDIFTLHRRSNRPPPAQLTTEWRPFSSTAQFSDNSVSTLSFFCTCYTPDPTTFGSDSSTILVFLPKNGIVSFFSGGMLREPSSRQSQSQNPNLRRRNQVAPRPKSLHCTFSRSVSLRLPSRSGRFLPVCCLTRSLSRTPHSHQHSTSISLYICVNVCCQNHYHRRTTRRTDGLTLTLWSSLIAVP